MLIAANREIKQVPKPKPTYRQYVPKAVKDKNQVVVDKASISEITEIPKEIMEKVFRKKKSAFE
jgi:hypothetical protein